MTTPDAVKTDCSICPSCGTNHGPIAKAIPTRKNKKRNIANLLQVSGCSREKRSFEKRVSDTVSRFSRNGVRHPFLKMPGNYRENALFCVVGDKLHAGALGDGWHLGGKAAGKLIQVA